MKFHLMGLACGLLSFCLFAAPPTVVRTLVNGFDTYIVNTHFGNKVAITANVQVGAFHDDPVTQAGAAHLFEHWIHGGSLKYPGHTTFLEKMDKIGGEYNAYTSTTRTFYHWAGHQDLAEEAGDLMGAMLSRPEFNLKTYSMELSTVKEEAGSYQKQDGDIFNDAMAIYLYPQGHPRQMYHLGTQAQLDAMDPEYLKRLFLANYAPGTMQLIIGGNFDIGLDGKPINDHELLLNILRKNFVGPDPQARQEALKHLRPAIGKVFPDVAPKTSTAAYRVLELGTQTPDRHWLSLQFQQQGNVNPDAEELLYEYLNLTFEGSFVDQLKKKGWVTSVGSGVHTVNNLRISDVTFYLTEEGAKRREEVASYLFSALHDLKKNGIRQEILDYLARKKLLSLEDSLRDPELATEHFAQFLDSRRRWDLGMQFQRFESVTARQIIDSIDRVFPIDKLLIGYLGSEVTSLEVEPVFNRPMRRFTGGYHISTWKSAFSYGGYGQAPSSALVLPNVTFPIRSAALTRSDSGPRPLEPRHPNQILAIEERHDGARTGIYAELKLEKASVEDQVATSVLLQAYKQKILPRTEFLASQAIHLSVEASDHGLLWSAQGNAEALPGLLNTSFEGLLAYQPTPEELQWAREKMIKKLRNSLDTFPAHLAHGELSFLLAGPGYFNTPLILKALENIDLSKAAEIVQKRLPYTKAIVVGSGDLLPSTLEGIADSLNKLYSSEKWKRAVDYKNEVYPPLTSSLAGFYELPPGKGEDQFAWTRGYHGPAIYSREHAALEILNIELARAVFNRNRVEKELGYVHSAGIAQTRSGARPVFFGQTVGREKIEEIPKGWDEVIERVHSQTLSSDDFYSARRGLVLSQKLLPFSDLKYARRILHSIEMTQDPSSRHHFVSTLSGISSAEIYSAGRNYLRGPTLDVVASTKPLTGLSCGELITSYAEMDARLRGNKTR